MMTATILTLIVVLQDRVDNEDRSASAEGKEKLGDSKHHRVRESESDSLIRLNFMHPCLESLSE